VLFVNKSIHGILGARPRMPHVRFASEIKYECLAHGSIAVTASLGNITDPSASSAAIPPAAYRFLSCLANSFADPTDYE